MTDTEIDKEKSSAEPEASKERIAELEALGRKLTEVVEDFMPNIGKCVLQDYGRLNEALIESNRLLGRTRRKV